MDLFSRWSPAGRASLTPLPRRVRLAFLGRKNGDDEAVGREQVTARRVVGMPGDTPILPMKTAFRSMSSLTS